MPELILTDDTVFDEDYLPDMLIGREGQIKEIARCLNPARSGKSIRNLFIFGPPGVGKTTVCKWILNENFSRNSVYVNCWSLKTPHKIMGDILLKMGKVVHGREPTTDLVKRFEKSCKKVMICLDECDHLKDFDILYDIVRNSGGVILISNDQFSLSKIDGRIRSSLFLNEIEFRSYSRQEIFDILSKRVSYGIRKDALSESTISLVSGMCGGDARIGLQTLRVAANEAESKGLDSITLDEVKSAAKFARKYKLSYLLGKLNNHQRAVYEILKRNRAMESGKLYSDYCKVVNKPVVARSYRNHIDRMEELGLVKSEGSSRWKKYKIII